MSRRCKAGSRRMANSTLAEWTRRLSRMSAREAAKQVLIELDEAERHLARVASAPIFGPHVRELGKLRQLATIIAEEEGR